MYNLLSRHNLLLTSDVDEALEVIGDSYEPHAMTGIGSQIDGDIIFNAVALNEIAFTFMRSSVDSTVTPLSSTPVVHVKIPLVGHGAFRAEGAEPVAISRDHGLVYLPSPHSAIDVRAGSEELNVRIPARSLAQIAGSAGIPARLGPVLDLRRPGMRSWLRMLRGAIMGLDSDASVLTSSLAVRHFEDLLISSLLAANALPGHAGGVRGSAVGAVVDLVESLPERPWRLAELADAAGVTVPELQAAFRQETGMGPLTCLRRIRLRHAHAQLIAADPAAATVEEIARRWGFAHQGRFAAAFRKEFGLSPSEALRQR